MNIISSINMDMVIITIILCIILIVIRYTIVYSKKINETYGELSQSLDNLTNYFEERNETNESIQEALTEIDKYLNGSADEQAISYSKFQNFSILKFAWENYYKKLNIEFCYSFVHPKEIFNRELLLNTTLKRRDFIKAIPGLLTSIGLAGTFTAILLGLVGINPSDMGTINQLIHGLWGKFLSSIVALVCAILFVRNEKQKYSDLNEKCVKLQEVLVNTFPVKNSTEILFEQSKQMAEALSAFENQSFKGVKRMVETFQNTLSENTVSLFKEIANITKELTSTIQNIQEQHDNYLNNMKEIRNTSKTAFENQQKLVESMQISINDIKEYVANFSKLINENNEYLERMSSITDKLAQVGEQFSATAPTLAETNNSIQELSSNLNDSINHFREISEQLSNDKFTPIIETLKAEITGILTQITDNFVEAQNYFDSMPNTLEEIVQEQVAKIADAMGNYSETTNEFLNKYDENMHNATRILHTNILNTEQTFEKNIESLNKNFNKLNKTLENVNAKINGEV